MVLFFLLFKKLFLLLFFFIFECLKYESIYTVALLLMSTLSMAVLNGPFQEETILFTIQIQSQSK